MQRTSECTHLSLWKYVMYFADQRDTPSCPRTYLSTNIDVDIFLFHTQDNVKLL